MKQALSTKVTVLPKCLFARRRPRKSVLTLFGTRPEVIKLAAIINELEKHDSISTFNVASGQHTDLLYPFIEIFGIRIDRNLRLMTPNQDPAVLCAQICEELDAIVDRENPDLILVQGDTTTALAGALVGHRRGGVPVGHVEAGLRSGDLLSPYPEEMNRRQITQLATYHFAATLGNQETLLSEGIDEKKIFVTGNPVVDALQMVLRSGQPACDPNLLAKRATGSASC